MRKRWTIFVSCERRWCGRVRLPSFATRRRVRAGGFPRGQSMRGNRSYIGSRRLSRCSIPSSRGDRLKRDDYSKRKVGIRPAAAPMVVPLRREEEGFHIGAKTSEEFVERRLARLARDPGLLGENSL